MRYFWETLSELKNSKITAVIRTETEEMAVNTAKACIRGGISSIEITYTVPNAGNVIRELKQSEKGSNAIIGAGTVLDPYTAKMAIEAGAEFIVGPNFDKDIAKLSNQYQIPYLAGCMTINEMIEALQAGVSVVKLFPGSEFNPKFIRSVKAVLPAIPVMPTGGVSLNNIQDWLAEGVFSVGVGSELCALAKFDDYTGIENLAAQFVSAVEKSKGE